eukprot:Partr_v1_DN28174_c0_g1_i2_m55501 putative anaphase promoting complex subunit 4
MFQPLTAHPLAIGEPVKFISWAPHTDLLAVAGISKIMIMRLDGQRVWSVPLPPSPAGQSDSLQGLVWREDGNVLRLDYGMAIVLLDVETGSVILTSSDDTIAFSWTEIEVEQESLPHNTHLDLIPALPDLEQIPGKYPSSRSRSALSNVNCIDQSEGKLNVSISIDDQCRVHFCTFGHIPLTVLDIKQFTKCHHVSAVWLDSNSRTCLAVVANIDNDGKYVYNLLVFHAVSLFEHARSVSSVSTRLNHMRKLFNYLKCSVEVTTAEYNSARSYTKAMARKFEAVLANSACSSASDIMYGIAIQGLSWPRINDFLRDEISSKGVSKWKSTVEAGYVSTRLMVANSMQNALLKLIFCLHDLSAYSMSYQCIYGAQDRLSQSIQLLEAMMYRSEQIITRLNIEMEMFAAFTEWLGCCVKKTEQSNNNDNDQNQAATFECDLSQVLAWIDSSLDNDPLFSLFQGSDTAEFDEVPPALQSLHNSCFSLHRFVDDMPSFNDTLYQNQHIPKFILEKEYPMGSFDGIQEVQVQISEIEAQRWNILCHCELKCNYWSFSITSGCLNLLCEKLMVRRIYNAFVIDEKLTIIIESSDNEAGACAIQFDQNEVRQVELSLISPTHFSFNAGRRLGAIVEATKRINIVELT